MTVHRPSSGIRALPPAPHFQPRSRERSPTSHTAGFSAALSGAPEASRDPEGGARDRDRSGLIRGVPLPRRHLDRIPGERADRGPSVRGGVGRGGRRARCTSGSGSGTTPGERHRPQPPRRHSRGDDPFRRGGAIPRRSGPPRRRSRERGRSSNTTSSKVFWEAGRDSSAITSCFPWRSSTGWGGDPGSEKFAPRSSQFPPPIPCSEAGPGDPRQSPPQPAWLEEYKRQRGIQTEFGSRDMVYLLALRSLNRYRPLYHVTEAAQVTVARLQGAPAVDRGSPLLLGRCRSSASRPTATAPPPRPPEPLPLLPRRPGPRLWRLLERDHGRRA